MDKGRISYEQIDWRTMWLDMQDEKAAPSGSDKWDKRAEEFSKRTMSPYSRKFVEYLDIDEGDTILDMGCGTGELAVMLSNMGHEVNACDFSSGMLGYLDAKIQDRQITKIHTRKMSWDDDWTEFGLVSKSVDVAIASRSIMVPDLDATLRKLNDVARKKVAVTLSVGSSPGEDPVLLEALGRTSRFKYDAVVCMNMLFGMGLLPELRYIDSDKVQSFHDRDEAVRYALDRLRDPTEEDVAKVGDFISDHLVRCEDDGEGRTYRLDYISSPRWAFISWNV